MPTKSGGWGHEGWGYGPWGGAESGAVLTLVGALAVSENVMRLLFNLQPYVSNLGDAYDGGSVSHYTLTANPSTGYDGQPARQVNVIVAAPSGLDPWGSPINGIDLTTDRPMSPFPAEYTVSCANLVDQATGTVPLSPSPQSIDPPGLLRHLQSGSATLASPNRDFLNPQTASSLAGSTAGADSAM